MSVYDVFDNYYSAECLLNAILLNAILLNVVALPM
jgi:hypothetical protein